MPVVCPKAKKDHPEVYCPKLYGQHKKYPW